MPTGLVPATDGRLVVALQDGLFLLEPDSGTVELLSSYPAEIGGRCNDASADLDGNLITGKLNFGPGEGSAWWYSATAGWRLIDDDIANTNGPTVAVIDGEMTLIIGDSSAEYFAYAYAPASGVVGERRLFGDTRTLDGVPDGATLDDQGGLWCALFGGRQLARFTSAGLDRTLPMPVQNPTDVTFGGPQLDRLYVTSTASPDAAGGSEDVLDGALLVIDGLDVAGRLEPRYAMR
jgi:sugar lactone lactonase YvrE